MAASNKASDSSRESFLRIRASRELSIVAGMLGTNNGDLQREVVGILGPDGFTPGDGGKRDLAMFWQGMVSIVNAGNTVTPELLLDALIPHVKDGKPDGAYIAELYGVGISTTPPALLVMARRLAAMNRREKLANMFLETAGRMFDLDIEPDYLLHKVVERAGYGKRSSLKCISLGEMFDKEYPPRIPILDPLICKKDLLMVYALRGVGKTYFALSIAIAVASGGSAFGRWVAPSPAKVLYIDGEMPVRTIKERIGSIIIGQGKEKTPQDDYLQILTPDEQDGPMPNLALPEGQAEIEPFLKDVSLVIIDNLATLCRTKDSFKEDSWAVVQSWILDLRRRGMAVLLVHHAGKSGDQRGTIAKEDVLDCVIKLKRPDDYKSSEGARFEVEFTKARNLVGQDAEPFEALLVNENNSISWKTKSIDNKQDEELISMVEGGLTFRQIAQDLGIHYSTVSRRVKALKEAGRIPPKRV